MVNIRLYIYIYIDSLIEHLIPHTKKFSVLSVNIQSINAKFDKLLALITCLNDNNLCLVPYASRNHG